MLTQPVLPLGERDHCQVVPLMPPSSSSSNAVTGTLAWIDWVSVVSVTTPGSSTFSTMITTTCDSSMVSDVLPKPSRPSCTSTVTL